jgi:hypothetical protein
MGPARPPEWVETEGEAESHTVMFRRGKRDVFLFRAGPGGVPDGKLKLAEGVTIFGKGEYVRLPGSFDAEDEDRFEPGCAVGEVNLAPVLPIAGLESACPQDRHGAERCQHRIQHLARLMGRARALEVIWNNHWLWSQ